MSTIELTSVIRQIKELQQLIDEATAEMETYKDTIKAEMKVQGKTEMTVDIFKIRWNPQTSNRFDTTRFKTDHAELYTAYTKQTTSQPFIIA